ncbi:ribulose-phosphate 3-epimerase, putative [Trypanosoma equiperdum]|uniref:ribulose-phosphate 3-epimerase n=2 Tax=Trypanozoon TaxID=39700 RepID=B2ZWB1_TRYB2|nr:ribulose-phosphate 3-epimerase, putative [Trypanosoma brucei brucei TREU927]SCU70583.1 ribulose-phosphate 3-epimerase, putative [Trypanosoma equiperdum]
MYRFDHQDKSTFLSIKKKEPLRPIISPSLMVADPTQLLLDSLHVLSPEGGAVEWLHVDVIDGHFAPNMSFCPDTVVGLRRHLPRAFLDIHLMVTEPEKWVRPFANAGASQFTFHLEAANDAMVLAREIRAVGMQVGIAISPHTAIDALIPLIDGGFMDMVLVMTVVPGFAGQKFMEGPLEKVKQLRERYPHLNIQVDGSINLDTVNVVAAAGANCLVPGQAVFKAKDRRENVNKLRHAVEHYLKSRL